MKPCLKQMGLRLSLAILLLSFFIPYSYGQAPNPVKAKHQCGLDVVGESLIKLIPDAFRKGEIAEKNAVETLNQIRSGALQRGRVTKIPVVWYIVHDNGADQIDEQRVLDNMDVLNAEFKPHGFEFCFATAYGNAPLPTPVGKSGVANVRQSVNHPGIMWVNHPQLAAPGYYQGPGSPTHAVLTGLSDLPEENYLRIFTLEDMHYGNFTFLPGTAPADGDGIFMYANTIGSKLNCAGCPAGQDEGKVLVHEAGHYLNLLHTFSGGTRFDPCPGANYPDCETFGDRVCDTPPTQISSSCSPTNSCTNDVPDLMDLNENFMTWSNDACQNSFTAGQIERATASALSYRAAMIDQANLDFTGINCVSFPLSCFIEARMHAQIDQATYTVTFVDNSLYNPVTTAPWQWAWDFGDGSTSTAQYPSHTYAGPGIYWISFWVNAEYKPTGENCENHIVVPIRIGCPPFVPACDVAPDFAFSQVSGTRCDYQFMDATVYPPCLNVSYNWTFPVAGGPFTTQNPQVSFPNSGWYTVSLEVIGDNGVDPPCTTSVTKALNLNCGNFGKKGANVLAELSGTEMEVFPNPASSEITVRIPSDWESSGLQLFDMKGQLVLRSERLSPGQDHLLGLDNLGAGVYLLRLNSGTRIATQRIVVE